MELPNYKNVVSPDNKDRREASHTVVGARLLGSESRSDSLSGGGDLRCGEGQQSRESKDAELHDESV